MRRLGVLLSNSDLSQTVLRAAADGPFTATVLPKDWCVTSSRDTYDLLLTDSERLAQCFTGKSGHDAPQLLLAVSPDDDLTERQAPIAGLVRSTHLLADLADALRLIETEPMPADDCQTLSSSLLHIDSSYALSNHRQLAFAVAQTLRRSFQIHAGATSAMATRMAAAAFEAVENAMFHGNLELSSGLRQPAGADGYAALLEQRQRQHPYRDRRVWVTSRITPQDIQVTVRDEGQGFDVSQWNASTPAAGKQPRCVRGRGWLVLQHFCDDVRYNEVGTEVTLAVLLAGKSPSSHNLSSAVPAPSPLV